MAVLVAALTAVALLTPQRAVPQQQAQPPPAQQGATPPGPGWIMGGWNRGAMMNGMIAQNQQMSDTMKKMMQNMAAMQKESDPANLKKLITDQRAMMEQMRVQMATQRGLTQNMMQGSFGTPGVCPMFGGTATQPGAPAPPPPE
jgi:hypothetical protein